MPLIIRDEQMDVFHAARRRDVVRRLADQARRDLAPYVRDLPDPDLCDRIDRALARAVSNGLVVRRDQFRYALLALRASDAVLASDAARDIMNGDAAGLARLDRLERMIDDANADGSIAPGTSC